MTLPSEKVLVAELYKLSNEFNTIPAARIKELINSYGLTKMCQELNAELNQ